MEPWTNVVEDSITTGPITVSKGYCKHPGTVIITLEQVNYYAVKVDRASKELVDVRPDLGTKSFMDSTQVRLCNEIDFYPRTFTKGDVEVVAAINGTLFNDKWMEQHGKTPVYAPIIVRGKTEERGRNYTPQPTKLVSLVIDRGEGGFDFRILRTRYMSGDELGTAEGPWGGKPPETSHLLGRGGTLVVDWVVPEVKQLDRMWEEEQVMEVAWGPPRLHRTVGLWRSGLGVTGEGNLLMVVTENLVTPVAFAMAMQALGAKDAMMLDGGRSSHIWVKPTKRFTEVHGGWLTCGTIRRRKLPTVLQVYARKP